MDILSIVVGALIGIVVGYLIGNTLLARVNKQREADLDKKREEMNKQADAIIEDARRVAKRKLDEASGKAKNLMIDAERQNENIKQTKILEAKEKYIRFKAEFENETSKRKQRLKELELKNQEMFNKIKQEKQDVLSEQKKLKDKYDEILKVRTEVEQRQSEIDIIKDNLTQQLEIIAKRKATLEKANEEHIHALEKVAKLTEQEAKEELLKAVKDKAASDAMALIKDAINEAKATANKEAKKIVIQSIQRMCAEYTIENTVSVFNLDSDDLKGQIIGREGRNIRALEAATGAEIVVDDTPEAIVISSFDPVRREVCRLSLQRLVSDGRIHPARIEEVVAKTKKQLEEQIMEIGERTVIELNIHGLKPQLVRMVGRMRFRSSYGQNLLKHSIETAHLCALIAAELGLSPKQAKMAKRAGLLHDIGKVAEEETELSHAILGMKMCEKYGEHPAIINAVGAHHDEIEMTNILSPIIQAGDAISGARPGARREILESYLTRIRELETLALSYDGVQKAYAMQAGRELRVIVESDKVTDDQAETISFQISEQIQSEMQYPGQIKVTVIREKRATSFAR
jgi:ribonucrease Y